MGVEYFKVEDAEDAGQRIDNFLIRRLKGVPRQRIYRILRKGEVRVNGGRVKPTYRLAHHDEVRIPPVRHTQSLPPQVSQRVADLVEAAIIHEDDNVIVLDKPAGLAVHGGSSISAGAIEILRAARGNPKLELAHRLDRDTSGCLLICKSRAVLASVQSAFRNRQVRKIYDVFVVGLWPKKLRTVQKQLMRYETSWGERRVRVDARGQTARTDFMVVQQAPHATRLEAVLHTGRTHQIRVHCLSSGYPIVGDSKYAARDSSRETQHPKRPSGGSRLGVPDGVRLCLHAARISVPIDGRVEKFKAPLPDEMANIWRRLSEGEQLG